MKERETLVLQQNAVIGITDTASCATYAFLKAYSTVLDALHRNQNPKFPAGIFVIIFVTSRYRPSKN
jgi:hypothetical protein